MANIDSLMRQAQQAIRTMDPRTKNRLRKKLGNGRVLDDAQGLKRMVSRAKPSTFRRLEKKYGIKVRKSDLQALDAATIQRLARMLKAQLDR